ncbi:tetraacyldisaccharide 4'-kinase [Aestuariispira insulae]|uniref:Tetraacyldisaccharide 4'-kinase n=1 Tax=Aestuariispira insulae TaxID=1461337 RepID=A0A3D9HXB4_9PROT|nr:tetraacyldisaccharide 4'-kinase [Aestuariispira insulae]RED54059.1 lipid-A-disaccharide kinase [Aestuariispira insulae]
MRQPRYWTWDQKHSLPARLLAPLGCVYWGISQLRNRLTTPYHSQVPVICVGNAVAGGAGKTPVAQSIARMLQSRGKKTHFLSRGYGGSLPGPVLVDPNRHNAGQIGDEPLLLAKEAPVTVSRDRVKGIKEIEKAGCDLVIMDDGYQNPSLKKNLSLLVIDAGFGFGNERLIPAGPLREPITNAIKKADAILLLGDGEAVDATSFKPDKPVFRGQIISDLTGMDKQARYLAFAGIGRPEKFRDSLQSLEINLSSFHAFADHHSYHESDLEKLVDIAGSQQAELLTTEKDYVRLPESYKDKVKFVPISIRWDNELKLLGLLESIV